MRSTLLLTTTLLLSLTLAGSIHGARKESGQPLPDVPSESESNYVYLAPNVIQNADAGVFSSFAFTNTSPYWFNLSVYLVSTEGEIVLQLTPLLKGFGTWQQSSGALIQENFQGSIWVVSAHPLVGVSMNYQLRAGNQLSNLATVQLERLSSEDEVLLPGILP